MRRIHTTYDPLEAHLTTAMLREHGIDAWLFDADFVRQDWLKAIAFGGYRIMVSDDFSANAGKVLQEYKNGTLALDDEQHPACPNCGEQRGIENPSPRRHVFLALIVWPWIATIASIAWKPSTTQLVFAFASQIGLYLFLPWLAIWYFKWPSRCGACGYRWRQPPMHRHAELARLAQAGESTL
jgi:hypothetical protein